MKTQTGYAVVGKVLEALVEKKAYKAAAYLSDKFVVRMSRKLSRNKVPAANQNIEISLTIGRPNYEQRKYISMLKKAKVSFPVKNVILKFPPVKRVSKKVSKNKNGKRK